MSNPNNPLLAFETFPPFSKIHPEHVLPAIETRLKTCRETVETLLAQPQPLTWENLVAPLELVEDQLNRTWSPVSLLNAVVNTPELREAYNAALPLLSDYSTEMGQHRGLYDAFLAISESADFKNRSHEQQKVIENRLRDFKLSGVSLETDEKERYREISQKLSKLTSKFSENVLDCTNQWEKMITDETLLAGLPESALALAKQSAKENAEGDEKAEETKNRWRFTLEFPSYLAVMTYADNRDLRAEMYEAFATRASETGPHDIALDNSAVMAEILALRQEKAKLLGFESYADYSLATKMADSPRQVVDFLDDLAARSLNSARAELQRLRDFVGIKYYENDLQAWDIAYYSEKLKEAEYAISEEELKPWFPLNRVLQGMFAVVEKLYGIQITEKTDVAEIDTWHESVQFFEITDKNGEHRGTFYLDPYARPHKRGGAWMDECAVRHRSAETKQQPIAYLVCNFTPPIGDDPALLTHDEVVTLFHEFGHGLHHLLTQVDEHAVSGINGVPWDAVELPSQFLENWCWQEEALPLFSGHYQTGEALPHEKFTQLLASRNFQSAMGMVRQLEFSLFDFKLHQQADAPKNREEIYATLETVREQVSVMKPPAFNRFPHSFSHIFAGGYAAGYYSYKWAEVLSADAFSLFEEHGIFNTEKGEAFLNTILAVGGTYDLMKQFKKFRGREPKIDALLKHSGIQSDS